MEEPSSTQGVQDHPKIFLKDDNTPVSVFAQAEDIIGRPKLARLLKRGGASICTDPKLADIILVNEESETGRQFIRVWRQDGERAVLQYTWVEKSVRAGRMLKEADNWGGCLTGNGEEGAENNEQERQADNMDKSPLPTPRPSPDTLNKQEITASPDEASHSVSQINGFPGSSLEPDSFQPATQVPPTQPGLNIFGSQGIPPDSFMVVADVLRHQSSPGLQLLGAQIQAMAPSSSSQWRSSLSMEPPPSSQSSLGQQSSQSSLLATFSRESTPLDRGHSPIPVDRRSIGIASPSASYPASSSAVPSKLSNIFSNGGIPIKFFVQVSMQDRLTVVNAIKKNGGVIVSPEAAEYSILSSGPPRSQRQKEYEKYVPASLEEGIPAVTRQFVLDCVEESELLDYTPYLCEAPSSSTGKRGRPPTDAGGKAKKAKKTTTTKKRVKEEPQSPVRALQISPTAPNGSMPVASGSRQVHKYTEEEKAFAIQIAIEAFSQDPDTSDSAIASMAHDKMPHHSLASWRAMIGQDTAMRKEIADARKKGGIRYRKRRAQLQAQHEMHSRGGSTDGIRSGSSDDASRVEQQLRMGEPTPPGPGIPSPTPRDLFEQDLEVISDFFAFAGGDLFGEYPTDRGVVWGLLEGQAHCRSAHSWEAFYGVHHAVVTQRYEAKRPNSEA